MIDGDDDGGIDFGFDDGGLDLSFDNGPDPTDLNEADMSAGTEKPAAQTPAPASKPASVTQDLSGAPAKKVPVQEVKPTPPPATTQTPPPPAGTQPPAVETPGAAAQPQPAVDIEEFVTANAVAIVDNLVKSHFKIDATEAEALGFAPEVTSWIEKQNAKNFLLTMVQVNKALQQTLPTVVANLVELTNQTREVQQSFYGDFPALKDPKLVPHLKSLAVTLRGLNPTMDKAEFQTLLGQTAHNLLKIPLPVKTAAPAGRPGVRRGQPRPFTPAGASAPARGQGGPEQLAGLDFLNMQLRGGDDG